MEEQAVSTVDADNSDFLPFIRVATAADSP